MCVCFFLTHWGRATHICVSKLTTIGSDKDLSPGRRQAIIWTNAGILLIGPLGINFSGILIEIYTVSFNKVHMKMSSANAKWRLFRLGLNELIQTPDARRAPINLQWSEHKPLGAPACTLTPSVLRLIRTAIGWIRYSTSFNGYFDVLV